MRPSAFWALLWATGSLICGWTMSADDSDKDYKIPNGLDQEKKGFFHIESAQSAFMGHSKGFKFEVHDYFSLERAISFSVYEETSGDKYTLISDGPERRSYIFRQRPADESDEEEDEQDEDEDDFNFDDDDDDDEDSDLDDVDKPNNDPASESFDADLDFDCELDNAHSNRHTFPWLYEKPLETATNRRRRTAAIYGVGSIWLNAIELGTTSKLVGNKSPLVTTNSWHMSKRDIKVELLFTKPEPFTGSQEELDRSSLESVTITRDHSIEQRPANGSEHSIASAREVTHVIVRKVETEYNDESQLQMLERQLEFCRHHLRDHLVFPSLHRALSQSSQRLAYIEYIHRRPSLYADGQLDAGRFDAKKHRYLFPTELTGELLSLKEESFVKKYRALRLHNDEKQQLDQTEGEGRDRVDRFVCSAKRQISARRTEVFHMIENLDGKVQKARKGEMEEPPDESIMRHNMRYTYESSRVASLYVNGLMGLLMNVAESSHKSVSLARKQVKMIWNPMDLDEVKKQRAYEWIVDDPKLKLLYVFYFRTTFKGKKAFASILNGDLRHLIRVDVHRRPEEETDTDEVIVDFEDDDANLVEQYFITRVDFQLAKGELKSLVATDYQVTETGDVRELEEETKKQEEQEYDDQPTERLPDGIDIDDFKFEGDREDEKDEEPKQPAYEADSVFGSLLPGYEEEHRDLPDFLSFVGSSNGERILTIDSRLDIMQPQANSLGTRKSPMYLRETIDLSNRPATTLELSWGPEVANSRKKLFIFDYQRSLIFYEELGVCQLISEEAFTWLRLLSARLPHQVELSSRGRVIRRESSQIGSYGVSAIWQRASRSPFVRFVGQSGESAGEQSLIWDVGDPDGLLHVFFVFKRSPKSEAQLSYKDMRLDSIHFRPRSSRSKFRPIRLTVELSAARDGSGQRTASLVPDECNKLVSKEEEQKKEEKRARPIPSFDLFVDQSAGFESKYELMQQHKSKDAMRTIVLEQLDLKHGRAKLELERAKVVTVLYAEPDALYLYSKASGRCKPVKELKIIEGVEEALELQAADQTDSRPRKLYGLSGLWSRLAAARDAQLVVHRTRLPLSGLYRERLEYKLELGERRLSASFSKPIHLAVAGGPELLAPSHISISAPAGDLRGRTSVFVHRVRALAEPAAWQLPDSCKPAAVALKDFPSVSSLMSVTKKFHAKSHVSIKYPPWAGLSYNYALDEWLSENRLRVVSHELIKGASFDFIFNRRTGEVFDISQRYSCKIQALPQSPSGLSRSTIADLTNLWALEPNSNSNSNSDGDGNLAKAAFYGALGLWHLADRSQTTPLSQEVELSLDLAGTSFDDQFESGRELYTATWRVTPPHSDWSYDMQFAHFATVHQQGQVQEWDQLRSITLPHISGATIVVELVNYSYDFDSVSAFAMPEGWGCMSNPAHDDNKHADELLATINNVDSSNKIAYLASLMLDPAAVSPAQEEVADNLATDPTSWSAAQGANNLPTLTGLLVERQIQLDSAGDKNLVRGQLAQTRYPGGQTKSTKRVCDTQNSLLFVVDRMSGQCKFGRSSGACWQLEFPPAGQQQQQQQASSNQSTTITLDVDLFKKLFLDTREQGFKLVNSIETSELEYTSYERHFDSLALTSSLRGYATVVRRFQNSNLLKPTQWRDYAADGQYYTVRERSAMSVMVLLFPDSKRRQLLARLDIRIEVDDSDVSLARFLKITNVAQCYNEADVWSRPTRYFTLEYPLDQVYTSYPVAWPHLQYLAGTLAKDLMLNFGLRSYQLTGDFHFDFGQRRLMRATFGALEPPPIELHMHKRSGARLAIDRLAETRLAPDQVTCSVYCSQRDCLAFSYCADHICRMVNFGAIVAGMRQNKPNQTTSSAAGGGTTRQTSRVNVATSYVDDPNCNYFYRRSARRAPALDEMVAQMSQMVNVQPPSAEQPHPLQLSVMGFNSRPSLFLEQPDKFKAQRKWAAAQLLDTKQTAFVLLHQSTSIDLAKVDQLNRQTNTGARLQSSTGYADSLTKCIERATSESAYVVSYCRGESKCNVVTPIKEQQASDQEQEPADVLTPEAQLGQLFVAATTDCSVMIQDRLQLFERFEGSQKPKVWQLQLDGASALACALACDQAGAACLSFDWCANELTDGQTELTFENDPVAQSAMLAGNSVAAPGACFLQATHVATQTLDETKLKLAPSTTTNTTTTEQPQVCTHYSKSFEASHQRIANVKFSRRIRQNGATISIPGVTVDRCAYDCYMDDQCRAFEFCYRPSQDQVQSCELIRSKSAGAVTDELWLGTTETELKKWFRKSSTCSIYIPRRAAAKEKLEHSLRTSMLIDMLSHPADAGLRILAAVMSSLLYLTGAVVVGGLVQLVYIKLVGDSLDVDLPRII